MKKRFYLLFICVLMCAFLLAGCGDGAKPASTQTTPPEASPTVAAPTKSPTIAVEVVNKSGYIFHELYVSPTAANEWGDDHLGSTSLLKNNGKFPITLAAYEFNTYDIQVLDEEGDSYLFSRVPMSNGSTVTISFDDGLIAVADGKDGSSTTVEGELILASSGADGDNHSDPGDSGYYAGYDTYGEFSFTIYNESDYKIYSIFIGPVSGNASDDIDVLDSVMDAHSSVTVTGTAAENLWGEEEWTLYIVDVDGDESASYDVFNPWELIYVDITWDSANGSYSCSFVY